MPLNTYIENYVPAVKFSRGIKTKLPITGISGGAATSGGNTTAGLVLGSTTTGSGVGVYFGSGAPTITAPKGSLYLRTDGTTTNDRAFVNTNGSTTWTALTTAA